MQPQERRLRFVGKGFWVKEKVNKRVLFEQSKERRLRVKGKG